MQDIIITLKIDKLAGLGDGVGSHDGAKVFVPYTIAGDVIRARIKKETADATYASIESIITPGQGRIEPVCFHFGKCGGCSLQHLEHRLYKEFKQQMASEAVRKASYDTNMVASMITLPAATRRRAELKVKGGKIGYFSERSHQLVDILECKVLEPELFALVMQLKDKIRKLPTFPNINISTIKINGVDDGYDVVMEGEDSFKLELRDLPLIKRFSIRKSADLQTVFQTSDVTIKLGDAIIEIPPGAFLQASREAQAIMTDLVTSAVKDASKVLDLFAGIGTYSFPLSKNAEVTAMEGDAGMVAAMQKSGKIKTEERDLFYNPLPTEKLNEYDAVAINPPRAGAKAQCEQLASSDIAKIVMVSCNPATFTRDARILKEGGYNLTKLTPIDQFVYSSHLEMVAEFSK